jgi:hypothetical protein
MKSLVWLVVVFIALMFPAITTSETMEKQESICEESVYYGEHLYISIAQIHEQLISLSWPTPPSFARIVGNAVFQIKVSMSGEVCSIESIGGQSIVLALLAPEIKKWKFSPNKPFWGIVAIRYTSSEGFRLL